MKFSGTENEAQLRAGEISSQGIYVIFAILLLYRPNIKTSFGEFTEIKLQLIT
jgi:hypothetical protein